MIKHIVEYDKYFALAGFERVKITNMKTLLTSIRKRIRDASVQFFDADLIAGWEHIYFATINALKAFKNKTNISKNLPVECLLYATAQKQIKVALKLVGIKPTSSSIAVLLITDRKESAKEYLDELSKMLPGIRNDAVINLSGSKVESIKRLFKITDTELATRSEIEGTERALTNLIIEHGALLVTYR